MLRPPEVARRLRSATHATSVRVRQIIDDFVMQRVPPAGGRHDSIDDFALQRAPRARGRHDINDVIAMQSCFYATLSTTTSQKMQRTLRPPEVATISTYVRRPLEVVTISTSTWLCNVCTTPTRGHHYFNDDFVMQLMLRPSEVAIISTTI